MKKLFITGANGIIGNLLSNNLSDYIITSFDLPYNDARDYNSLLRLFPKYDVVIHLAWDLTIDDDSTEELSLDNSKMFLNVYRAAVNTGVPRVIMASSVHISDYISRNDEKLITPDEIPIPDSLYSINKLFMENLGEFYSRKYGLEVVCLRLGGVNKEDRINFLEKGYDKVYLNHKDCISLFKKCIDAPTIPGNFLVIYGVSCNPKRIHDYSNHFGWRPE